MKTNATKNKKVTRGHVIHTGIKKPGHRDTVSRADRIWAVIVFFLAFGLYANTIPHKYLMDDYSVLSDNFVVKRGIDGIPTILTTPYRYGFSLLSDNLYRPLSQVMFAVEWQIAPDTPSLSHFINVLFYALTCVLLFIVLRRMLPDKVPLLPLLVTLLWLFHPVHTEVVANIKSRDEIMAAFFLFMAIYAFIQYLEWNKTFYLAGMLVAYLFAFFSKEGVITFLAIFPLIGWYFTKGSTQKILTASALLLLPAAIYFITRQQVLSTYATPFVPTIGDNLLLAAPDLPSRLATAIMILGKYLLLLIFPYQLVSDYSYNQIPIVGWANPLVWISLLIYLSAVIYAVVNIKKRSVLVFALLLFLISMSIYSNIFALIGTSFAERLLFLPSLGFSLLTGILLLKIPGNKPSDPSDLGTKAIFLKNPLIWIITGIILLLFSMKTLSRNAEWKDEITLISTDVKRSPNSAHMRYYAGLAYRNKAMEPESKEHYDELMMYAIDEFQVCVTILPSFSEGFEQLGLAYYRMKNPDEALKNYEKALQLNSGKAVTYSNLGIIFFEKGDFTRAFELYQKAVSLDTNFADGYFNLGSMYGMQGKYELAVENFQKAIRLNPGNAQAHYFMGITLRSLNKPDLAKEYLDRAGQLDPAYKK